MTMPTTQQLIDAKTEIDRLYGITVGHMIHERSMPEADWNKMCNALDVDQTTNVGHVSQALSRMSEIASSEIIASRVRNMASWGKEHDTR